MLRPLVQAQQAQSQQIAQMAGVTRNLQHLHEQQQETPQQTRKAIWTFSEVIEDIVSLGIMEALEVSEFHEDRHLMGHCG